MKVLVIGYYNRGNLGDDAYQGIMGQFFPNAKLEFICSDDISKVNSSDYEGVIVGGGDIINDYFHTKITPFLRSFKGPRIAFSIGIPFPSCITEKYLGYFDHIFVRNYEDLRTIQKVVGSHKVHFIPDIALSYKPSHERLIAISNDSSVFLESGRKSSSDRMTGRKCGIFLVGNLIAYPHIVEDMAHLISKIALTSNVTLYCFSPGEDTKISETVRDLATKRMHSNVFGKLKSKIFAIDDIKNQIVVDSTKYNAQDMVDVIADLDFAVCMRYHSHIFCTVAGTPFMSISSTRKTRSFMKQSGLSDYQYNIELDGWGTPIKSNYESMREVCRNALHHRADISDQLEAFLKQSRFLLASNQAAQLLTIGGKDIRNGVADFIKETGDYHNGARLLSDYVLGYPDSPYVWGMFEKFKATHGITGSSKKLLDIIHDSVQYLTREGINLKNEFIDLIHHENSLPFYINLREYQLYKGAHRGGWYVACEELFKHNSLNERKEPNGMICDMYIDRTFHWSNTYMSYRGIIPYTSPWCGFIHHTTNTSYSKYNTAALFENIKFIQSLHTCVALFALSEPLAHHLRERLSILAPHVKVVTFAHPVVDPLKLFSLKEYIGNRDRKLINIGAWMRNPFAIYHIPKIPLHKAILMGNDMGDHIPPANFSIAYIGPDPNYKVNSNPSQEVMFSREDPGPKYPCRPEPGNGPRWVIMVTEWLVSIGIQVSHYKDGVLYIFDESKVAQLNEEISHMIKSVATITYQSNENYDELLAKNIVFLDLIDAAAVNTIIECIVRRTPVIVNKIPGTVALLGENYPLFYKHISEVPSLISDIKINQAHQYLRRLDIKRFQMKYFMEQMTGVGHRFEQV